MEVHLYCMSKAEELILRDQPLPESEILVTLDLFSEEKTLGPGLPPKKVKEVEVRLGKWLISFLPPVKSTPTRPIMTPDRSKWDLYLVYIPFTLREPPEDTYYQRVDLRIDLANKDATAFDLLPKNVTTKEKVTKTYELSPEFKFKGVEVKVGKISHQICFESLRPIITAFGEGESRFYWVYTSLEGQEISPGIKHALVILEVPGGTESVSGTIYCEADMLKKMFGIFRRKVARSGEPYPINWNLREAKPLFEIEKSKTK